MKQSLIADAGNERPIEPFAETPDMAIVSGSVIRRYKVTMTTKIPDNPDERFYFEIWSGPSEALRERNPSVYYCENHNADLDYGLAATDFELAAEALIAIQRKQPNMGNWSAPVLHLIRQTLELKLKALIETITWKLGNAAVPIKFAHDLEDLWTRGRGWLLENGCQIEQDARLKDTDRLIENLHAIDPTGDLLRFGTSRKTAFGRQKSSDRVGFIQEELFLEFERACGCLNHWCGVVMREIIQAEQGWENDPYFDRNDFPKVEPNT
ncbi:hypothetical protein NKH53_26180 [Mesorhizobium australicum]|uniref:hypothetical protein n=1 Tax=Mesorhizobium australicum TaxID=536018 RepID=UPI003338F34E